MTKPPATRTADVLTLHPSHIFFTELRTFIPRICICVSVADGGRGATIGRGIEGRMSVIGRIDSDGEAKVRVRRKGRGRVVRAGVGVERSARAVRR